MNIITANNIHYRIKDKEILKNLSFAIPKGSITSIIGMNGSGKTTLLKLLCGIIKPTKGEIAIDNKAVKDYSIKERSQKISIVFQSVDTDFDFSVEQIVLMGRMPYQTLLSSDKTEDFEICKQSMSATGTWHLRNRLINSLSGGEKQRVFIARALCSQTDIIMLDEPVANLDTKHQIEIMKLLRQIQKENNSTILIVLHDLSLAKKFSDYVLALKDGQMRFFDKQENVLTNENIKSLFEINAKIVENNNVIIAE